MNPRISVIIVNYNVAYFLEQCLNSVREALKQVDGEVLVVDNQSVDGSVAMVEEKFPEVTLIANKENLGFSKANNQAMRISKGDYVLLLNPDTVIQEDCLKKVVDYMDARKTAGGLGVKMVDGKGRFLPESKRGLPTPAVAFWKLFGFSSLFPKSKIFGQYHLTYLDKNENHDVPILAGAFMLMRKSVLNEVGLLDEAFFMYGEDIDLSYRIVKAGYKNVYYADTSIIHYKGESTKKSSVNYVFVFYRAMIIFAQKHFTQKNAKLFSFLINLAIYIRAGAAILSRFVKRITLPLIDTAVILMGMLALTDHWERAGIYFPESTFNLMLPAYLFVWMSLLYIYGLYDKPFKWKKISKSLGVGLLVILVAYALLPKDFQFSRLYILISAAWVFAYLLISRTFLQIFLPKVFSFRPTINKRFGIIGDSDERKRVSGILMQTTDQKAEVFSISSDTNPDKEVLGTLSQLDEIVQIHELDEVIFCAKNVSSTDIIHWMKKLEGQQLDFKISQPESLSLIGSNSIETAGDLYLMHINKIEDPTNRRLKRIFDISIALIFLLISPIFVWAFRRKGTFLKNMLQIVAGRYSFVGYFNSSALEKIKLPRLRIGVLKANDMHPEIGDAQREKLNLIYARDYTISKDILILKNCWRHLDREVRT